jgi:hypothetical protein
MRAFLMEVLSGNNKTSCGFITDIGYTEAIKTCMLTMKKLQCFLTSIAAPFSSCAGNAITVGHVTFFLNKNIEFVEGLK